MKPIATYFCTTLLFIGGSSVAAQADVVFSDNFEDKTAVAWPDVSQDADPVAQTGNWVYVLEGTQDDLQVTDNVVPGPAEGSNYLVTRRDAGVHDTRLQGSWSTASSATDVITVDFDIYLPSTNPNLRGGSFFIQDAAEAVGSTTGVINGKFQYISAVNSFRFTTGATAQTDNFALDTWHHVRYEIDMATQTYDVTVSSITYEDIAFEASSTSLGKMMYTHLSDNSTFLVDDVLVEFAPVPEPGSMMMLLAGSLAASFRGRHTPARKA